MSDPHASTEERAAIPAGTTMRQVAIVSESVLRLYPDHDIVREFTLDGVPLLAALVEVDRPEFDPDADRDRQRVLLRKRAFSLNFRDKASILVRSQALGSGVRSEEVGIIGMGADFVADVVQVGSAVTDLRPGDRVISGASWPQRGGGIGPGHGLPTECASAELEVLPRSGLCRIPASMSVDVAGAFTIGAITSYAIVRKLALQARDRVLVTAATSNTSLFVLTALREKGVDVYALSTSRRAAERIRSLGVRDLFVVDPRSESFATDERLAQGLARIHDFDGFDAVVDPFFEVYAPKVVELMAVGGRYITCGVMKQAAAASVRIPESGSTALLQLGLQAVIRNLQFQGNCLGTSDDLHRAVEDHVAGRFPVLIDSVFRGSDVGAFLERSFNAPDRLGKVVYRFDPAEGGDQ